MRRKKLKFKWEELYTCVNIVLIYSIVLYIEVSTLKSWLCFTLVYSELIVLYYCI